MRPIHFVLFLLAYLPLMVSAQDVINLNYGELTCNDSPGDREAYYPYLFKVPKDSLKKRIWDLITRYKPVIENENTYSYSFSLDSLGNVIQIKEGLIFSPRNKNDTFIFNDIMNYLKSLQYKPILYKKSNTGPVRMALYYTVDVCLEKGNRIVLDIIPRFL